MPEVKRAPSAPVTLGRLIAALDTVKHRGILLFDTKDREFRLVPGTDILVILAASLSLDGSRLVGIPSTARIRHWPAP